MPTSVQFRRGTTIQNDAFTGADGELSIDTDKKTIRIHDNSTAGGEEVVVVSATQTLTNKTLTAPNLTSPTIGGTAIAEYISDTVGAMVNSNTENGISVTYDDTDNTLDFDVGDFDITLTGDVTGSGTVTNLGNVSFATTIAANSVALGTDTTGNYVATIADAGNSAITVTNSGSESAAVTLDINSERIQDIVGAMFTTTNTESGITVTYQDDTGDIDLDVNDPTITLTGAVTGSATMTNLGNVSITTTATSDPTITLAGDLSGSATLTNLGSATLTATLTKDPVITLSGAVTGSATMTNLGDVTVTTTATSDPTITLAGDLSGSATLTNLGNATLTATIVANSVALGTDTTGNYVGTGATSGNGISGSVSSEGGTFTVTSNATSSNSGNTIVFRDGSGNFNAGTITATTTQARYADLAENYMGDEKYSPGTVLVFGGEAEVTECTQRLDTRIAGIVSADPAFLMNEAMTGYSVASVALVGRVPCRVVGEIRKGDLMVASSVIGHAEAWRDESSPPAGSVIGKALEDKTGASEDVIEVVVGRL